MDNESGILFFNEEKEFDVPNDEDMDEVFDYVENHLLMLSKQLKGQTALINEEEYFKNNNFDIEDPVINQYPEIDKLLTNAPRIWLNTDWHLWIMDDEKNEIVKNDDFDNIIKFHNAFVGPEDVFIFLGDLIDDEMDDKELIKNTLRPLNGKKILVLGNNDIFEEEFYFECGFLFVVKAFKWGNLTFSHQPIKNFKDDGVNIHGHLHKDVYYDGTYGNHADIYTRDTHFRPVQLGDVVRGYMDGKYAPKERNDGPGLPNI